MTIDKVWDLEKIELMKKYPFENDWWLWIGLVTLVVMIIAIFLRDYNTTNLLEAVFKKSLIISIIILVPLSFKVMYDNNRYSAEKNEFFKKNEQKIMRYVDVESHDLVPLPGESKINYLIYNTQKENVTFQYKTNQGNKIETLSKENTYFNLLENSETPKISKQEEQFASKNLKKEFGYQREKKDWPIFNEYKEDRYVLHIPNQIEYGFVDN